MQKLVGFLIRFIVGLGFACVAVIFASGIMHIISILLIPKQAPNRIFDLVETAQLPSRQFSLILPQAETRPLLASQDPNFDLAICLFDLREGPISVLADKAETLWTLSIFNSNSENSYNLNDRLVSDDMLELLLVNPTQLAELQEVGAQELEKRIVVPLQDNRGFITMRIFKFGKQKMAAVEKFLASLKCQTFEELVESENEL